MHSVKITRLELLDIVKTNRESHIAEYNEAVEDVIEVEDDVFNQLVLDEWQWKTSFSISASSYKSFL